MPDGASPLAPPALPSGATQPTGQELPLVPRVPGNHDSAGWASRGWATLAPFSTLIRGTRPSSANA